VASFAGSSTPTREGRPRIGPRTYWRRTAATVNVHRQMQAFEAKPPPLTTGPEGVIRVSGTRVSLETVVYAFDSGSTAEEIVQQYPSLSLSNVYAIISYVLDNRESVDAYVAERRKLADALRAEIEARWPSHGLRARLLARGAKAPGG
jgi:uncharacterized protein (DUF433 family)